MRSAALHGSWPTASAASRLPCRNAARIRASCRAMTLRGSRAMPSEDEGMGRMISRAGSSNHGAEPAVAATASRGGRSTADMGTATHPDGVLSRSTSRAQGATVRPCVLEFCDKCGWPRPASQVSRWWPAGGRLESVGRSSSSAARCSPTSSRALRSRIARTRSREGGPMPSRAAEPGFAKRDDDLRQHPSPATCARRSDASCDRSVLARRSGHHRGRRDPLSPGS